MVLIFGDETQWEAMSEQEYQLIGAGHRRFSEVAGSGILAGQQIDSSRKSVTLKADKAGKVVVSDGPFLETKEVLGGFYLVEAEDREHVIKLASELREVNGGHSWVEVWPVVNNG
ncbi:MAG TPA: YciI family protein [Micromonosporaceae bacterium]